MFHSSIRTLKILAAITWYTGGIILLLKGWSLLVEANAMGRDQIWIWIAPITGLVLGGVNAKFRFGEICRKNIERIDALTQPRIWLFFRPWFLFFLFLMIMLGATLSHIAHHSHPFLIGVATLDFSMGFSLIGSSYVFWKKGTFAR